MNRLTVFVVAALWLGQAFAQPTITVTAPNGGEHWAVGSVQNVTWTCENYSANVTIDLNRNYPDGAWESLAANIANNGLFSWTVTAPVTTLARVRVTSTTFSTIFTATTPLPDNYYLHALVYAAGHLYNIGGQSETNGILDGNKVFFAPVQADGDVGAWTQGASLPEPVYFHSAVASGQNLYVFGGQHYNENNPYYIFVSDAVYISHLNADSSPGPWQVGPELPQILYLSSAVVCNGIIYVTGGATDIVLSDQVYSSRIQPDGSLGPWITQLPLPAATYAHSAVSNGALYVLGGVINQFSQVTNTVYYTQISSNGSLAGWAPTTLLPQPIATMGAVLVNGHIIITGGYTGSDATNQIIAASVGSDMSLGAWTSFAMLPHPLYELGAAASEQYLFVSGGVNGAGNQAYRDVYSAPLPPSDVSDSEFTIYDANLPPVIVISRVGNDMKLDWTATGTPDYTIYGSLQPDGGGDSLATVSDTTWTDTSFAMRPVEYFYYVKAVSP